MRSWTSPLEIRVLLGGETGTGKELVAEEIHGRSRRANQAFVRVNCAALPPLLAETLLFGYEKGAFTDAKAAKTGLIEAAADGTLFLDEVHRATASVLPNYAAEVGEIRIRYERRRGTVARQLRAPANDAVAELIKQVLGS